MKYYILIILINFYLCIHCSESRRVHKDNSFDYLIFTQHWPVTVCKEWKREDPDHTCQFPKEKLSWSIHGIWPNRNHTMEPSFCNTTWHFNPDEIRTIEFQLENLWVDVENRTTKYSLWSHEWEKHGTCAAALPSLNSEHKYFLQGLEWMATFNIQESLANNKIVPSDDKTYSVQDIRNAILYTWNVNPQIECRVEKYKQYLFEIRLCLDKSLQVIDCYGHPDAVLTNCNTDQDVLYPLSPISKEEPSNGMIYVEIYKIITWLRWFTL